jgi:deoxyadenosine/deoxycytidine kinase
VSVSPLKSSAKSSRYIAIEGPIGVGKTALAKRLAENLSADLVLEEVEELKLYDQIADNLAVDAPVPDLVIYLQASVDALMQRLVRRNSSYDRYVDRAYLERLTDAYARFFHAYDEGPLLIVNASQIDPVNNDADFEQLFQQIERTTGGRHFFNPVAAALA